jgi:CRP-like cAMP-binding protein
MSQPTSQDLQALPLFGGIGPDALARFAERCEVMSVAAGATIFTEGEMARSLYVVREGALEIIKHCTRGNVVLGTVLPGECVGEMSFIDMQPRSATVRATEASTLWVWAYSSIHERYCSDLKCAMLLVMNIARELSRRLRRADDQLVETTPVPQPRVWPAGTTPPPATKC